MEALHHFILVALVITAGLTTWAIYLFLVMHRAIKGMMAYHCDFAGSHERLELWVRAISKDLNTLAAAIDDDRRRLKDHDVKSEAMAVRADTVIDLLRRHEELMRDCPVKPAARHFGGEGA